MILQEKKNSTKETLTKKMGQKWKDNLEIEY